MNPNSIRLEVMDGDGWFCRPKSTEMYFHLQRYTVKHGNLISNKLGSFPSLWCRTPRTHRLDYGINIYKNILKDHMLPYDCKKTPRGWVFQQDNNPKL